MDQNASLLEVDESGSECGSSDPIELPSIVKPMELSIKKLSFILEKISKSDWAFDDRELEVSPIRAGANFLDLYDLIFEVGDFGGAILVSRLVIGRQAELSILLWDRAVMRKLDEGRAFIKWLMSTFQLNHIVAHLTPTNKLALRFDTKLGFKQEGVIRQPIVRLGKPMDVVVLGITREEVGLGEC